MSVPRLLVVGGNGFLGSAICKAAVGKGWEVSSMSSSGKPFTTPAGHTPAWVPKVSWHSASAFSPSSYSSLVSSSTAVVHTLGILLEDQGYKKAVREGDLMSLAGGFLKGLGGGDGNPLKTAEEKRGGYEGMNRDSALEVLNTMLSTAPHPSASNEAVKEKTFVYISAADAFRPLVPKKYIESKREAELEIAKRCSETGGVRPIFIRPGLMYHPHTRPLSTLPAFLIDLSSKLSAALPAPLQNIPSLFSPQSAIRGALEGARTFPLHVDHVANAVLKCVENGERRGVVEVDEMRRWAGFKYSNDAALEH
ncbi:mitochondrial protein [Cryptococcus neoformans]|nr:mitochondrial protein [Cryptococcus neoformans var. grubii]OXC58409.1 mitochondrial protein [Cryptococcus neoformans var. grubii MW-RSA852]